MQQFFKLIIEYDGGNYHGWQVQPNGITVQETIESALERITSQKIRIHGSGRTDAGVHALGQCANFACDTRLTPVNFMNALNSVLPDDIVIKGCDNVAADFHARFSAKSKRYRYCIWNAPTPRALGRQYELHVRKPLDLDRMRAAAAFLQGEHDFKGFETVGTPHATTIRCVYETLFTKFNTEIHFEIEANGFLRYMVRSIVGTLLEVGLGKRAVDSVAEILAGGSRELAGATAPAHGLTLLCVRY